MMKLNNVKIDQIRFMIPVKDQRLKENEFPIELNKVNNLFRFETIFTQKSILNFGRNGYTNSINYGSSEQDLVTIMFNPKRLDMGLLIDLTASGKAMFESLAQLQDIKVDWKRIIEIIYQKFQGHVSRIDVAIDLIDYGYSIDKIYNKLKNEEYLFLNARKQLIPAERIRYIGANNQVFTIYVGSRKSDAFMRLYDKKTRTT
ncbi:replication initiation factor domain-containing protein [uncultured Lactobacillus sp.]|uniref:replication initiation factor domain-containing protein n=1 Tax=uncultured Lactobacillus sp. TaxID=153152 RepID=UPI0025F0340E|nr:replication initiation factor domain-containing protein [uncultured Lactobacillus sp.]